MKQKKCQRVLVLLLGCLMLSGCGEAPYDLTEEEQQFVVSYSAHVVSKFNSYQKEGLTYQTNAEIKDEAEQLPVVSEPEETTEIQIPAQNETAGSTEVKEPTQAEGLDNAFADFGLTFTYLGNEVTASYMSGDTSAVNAGVGRKLLVLKFQVENLTDTKVELDNLSSEDVYSVTYVSQDGSAYHAKSVMTLLVNDFTTYEGTIEPQTGDEMVIVFDVPDSVSEVSDVELKVERKGDFFQINL